MFSSGERGLHQQTLFVIMNPKCLHNHFMFCIKYQHFDKTIKIYQNCKSSKHAMVWNFQCLKLNLGFNISGLKTRAQNHTRLEIPGTRNSIALTVAGIQHSRVEKMDCGVCFAFLFAGCSQWTFSVVGCFCSIQDYWFLETISSMELDMFSRHGKTWNDTSAWLTFTNPFGSFLLHFVFCSGSVGHGNHVNMKCRFAKLPLKTTALTIYSKNNILMVISCAMEGKTRHAELHVLKSTVNNRMKLCVSCVFLLVSFACCLFLLYGWSGCGIWGLRTLSSLLFQVGMNCTVRRFVDLAVASITKQLGLTGGEWCAKPKGRNTRLNCFLFWVIANHFTDKGMCWCNMFLNWFLGLQKVCPKPTCWQESMRMQLTRNSRTTSIQVTPLESWSLSFECYCFHATM